MRRVYADNNATTRVADEVFQAMRPFFTEKYGNPSSMHGFGAEVESALAEARQSTANLLGADPSEIVFTSGGTESDNAAILGALAADPKRRHIVTTRVEHPAVLNLCDHLAHRGYAVTWLPVDSLGRLDLADAEKAITEETAIVSIMYANNETGVIFPLEELATIAKNRGVPFHTDAVQAVGKIRLDMSKSNISFLSLSGHKLHAPKGIGAIYIRRGTKFRPLIIGGHQEKGRRGGTENAASIVGLGKACDLARDWLSDENSRVRKLRDKLQASLLDRAPDPKINGDPSNRLPNTLNISFQYVEGESILLLMDAVGIAASSGSACTSGSLTPSHVLRAMGVPFTFAHGSVRFSLSRYNTEDDIDYIIEQVPPIIKRLREISPFGRG